MKNKSYAKFGGGGGGGIRCTMGDVQVAYRVPDMTCFAAKHLKFDSR